MKPLALAVSLSLAACVHASPLHFASDALTKAITAAVNPPTPAESAHAVERLSTTLQPPKGAPMDWRAAFEAGIEAGKNLARESAAAAPHVAEQVATHPGPLGYVFAGATYIHDTPTAQYVLIAALVALLALVAKRRLTKEQAATAEGLVESIGKPIAALTPTQLDDFALAEIGKALHRMAQTNGDAADVLRAAHAEAGLPAPVLTPAPAQV